MRNILYALTFLSWATMSHAQLFSTPPQVVPPPKSIQPAAPTAIQSFKPYWSKGPIYVWSNPIKISNQNQIIEAAPRPGFFAVNTQIGPRWIGVTEADTALMKMKMEAAKKSNSLPYVELLTQPQNTVAATVASANLQSQSTQLAIEKHKKAMQVIDAAIVESMGKLTRK